MGIRDRQYMRDPYHPPKATTVLIVVLIVIFVLQSIFVFYGNPSVNEFIQHNLVLTLAGLKAGKVWELLTFQFLHLAPMPFHVLFNCIGLYFFGRSVEEILGTKKFLWIYFLAGTAGGLLQALVIWILPNHNDYGVVGASAGICGMIALFCTLFPMQELTTFIYFFPVNIRARYLLIFLTLYSLFGTIVPWSSTADAAHLGGILFGIMVVKAGWHQDFIPLPWLSWFGKLGRLNPFRSRPRQRELVGTPAGRQGRQAAFTTEPLAEKPAKDFISSDVDPILEKISAHGLHSLTDKERKILEAARKKMSGR